MRVSILALLLPTLALARPGERRQNGWTDGGTDHPCSPPGTNLQGLLDAGGPGYKLLLCPDQTYTLTDTLYFRNATQEISTYGYPQGGSRATLIVGGDPTKLVTAIRGTHVDGLDGITVRNIIVNGNRGNGKGVSNGAGLIELGGKAKNGLVKNVKSYDPRGWSCLHLGEGDPANGQACTGWTVTGNDLGPAGYYEQNWADGLSLACANSMYTDNTVIDATDGGIVVFGCPGSKLLNNRVSSPTRTTLGGIVLADSVFGKGNFSGLEVANNEIRGGMASQCTTGRLGTNSHPSIVKMGIAVGRGTTTSNWTMDLPDYNDLWVYGMNIHNNYISSGAFGWGMAVSMARDIRINNMRFGGNAQFMAESVHDCTYTGGPRNATALIMDPATTKNINVRQSNPPFKLGEAWYLFCFMPPNSTTAALWPCGDRSGWARSA